MSEKMTSDYTLAGKRNWRAGSLVVWAKPTGKTGLVKAPKNIKR
jgi:hypothetical protein